MHSTRDQESGQGTHTLNHLKPRDGTKCRPHIAYKVSEIPGGSSPGASAQRLGPVFQGLSATPSSSLPKASLPPLSLPSLASSIPDPNFLPFCLGYLGSTDPKSFLFIFESRMDDSVACDRKARKLQDKGAECQALFLWKPPSGLSQALIWADCSRSTSI